MPEALAAGPAHALSVAAGMAAQLTGYAVRAFAVPAVILGALLCAATLSGTLRGFVRRHRALLTAATTVLGLGIAFWYLNGNVPGNRLVTLAPVIQAVAAAVALDLDRRMDRIRWTGLLAALGVGSGAWTVLGSPSF
jgi:hypothetical protein